MSNLGDDELEQDLPGEPPEADAPEIAEDPERDPDSFWNRKPVRIARLTAVGLFIIGTSVSLYWARIPPPFDVRERARTMAVESEHRRGDQPLPDGYLTVSTMISLVEQWMDKPGGYLSNDWTPMGRIPDNMRNWEYGQVVQMRILVHGLRFDLSRPGPQAKDHLELREAEARFNFKHDSLVLPSTEQQYRDGLRFLRDFLQNLSTADSPGLYFAPRNDQLISWLERQKNMLGNYTTMLQANIGTVAYDTGILTSAPVPLVAVEMEERAEAAGEGTVEEAPRARQGDVNGFFKRDDVFYEVRGGVYALYHCMLAVRSDCTHVINSANAMGIMNRVINELELANNAMRSPVVLNGKEYGVIQNHSLVLAGHVAKAHLAVQELQQQLAGGGR